MIAALLHFTNYQFSFYAGPTLLTAVGVLLLALIVVAGEQFSFVSVSFLLVGMSIALWLGAFTAMYLAIDEPVALWWSRAAYLGVPFIPITIYQLAQQGLLPGLKVGGPWRFSEQMLESWAADQVAVERLRAEDQQSRPGRSGNPHRTTAKE